jgi:NAD-dependent aldehyde dehydrogenases
MAESYPILVGGEWIETEKTLTVKSPYDGSEVGITYLAGEGELERAVAASVEAFSVLREMALYEKADALRKVSSAIRERAGELARTIALEAGKPIKDARAEAERAAVTFGLAAEEAARCGGEILALDITPASRDRTGLVMRFPLGPVLGITPFNFPLNLVAHKVAPAMAAGCPIIVKPASKTPLTALLLGRIISEAGWPAGGVNILPSSGADAEKLVRDDRIKKLSFTGSVEVGWRLKSISGMKKVTLELGGNAGTIVCEDADLILAARRCTTGAFSYAGQICISVQRIYVARTVFDRFRDLFLDEVRGIKQGDPLDEATDLGPMIEEAAARRTEDWVKEAVSGGAEVLTGGASGGTSSSPRSLPVQSLR